MIAPCTCESLAKRVLDPDMPFVRRGDEFLLGDGSINDPRLTVHFCPFCGEHGWTDRGNRPCKCGVMESLAQDYPELMELDPKMNEFHVLAPRLGEQLQVYYCIACGGNPPKSRRDTFFEAPTDSEYEEARARIANLKNERDYIREFGDPSFVVDAPPLRKEEIDIYGRKQAKRCWIFDPPGSQIRYHLQLMVDGTYGKSLCAKHKKQGKA